MQSNRENDRSWANWVPEWRPTAASVAVKIRSALDREFVRGHIGEAVPLVKLYHRVTKEFPDEEVPAEMFHAALEALHAQGVIIPVASPVGCKPFGQLEENCSIRLPNGRWVLSVRRPVEELDHWPRHVAV